MGYRLGKIRFCIGSEQPTGEGAGRGDWQPEEKRTNTSGIEPETGLVAATRGSLQAKSGKQRSGLWDSEEKNAKAGITAQIRGWWIRKWIRVDKGLMQAHKLCWHYSRNYPVVLSLAAGGSRHCRHRMHHASTSPILARCERYFCPALHALTAGTEWRGARSGLAGRDFHGSRLGG